ncbi:hypothetical protein [Noviherbaspirillum saxi]|uniref:Uncharacterized protein n=1 Tax=Noviherbaspirillum saxi TaxID=2320863 RepID=A0A3A3G7T0_9BURK|nr:hypothetical protein [Noviherbaspirillum saxi]RJF98205.1 hypothetical protein D3871_06525 [Noviherbaspirillum saxi]
MAPSEKDVILILGYAVYEAQETEATLHLAMSVICGLSIAESLEHLQKIYAKKMLGQFLTLIREKIGLAASFDDFMKDYIERRNFIVHNLSRSSVFSLDSEEGRLRLQNFLTNFCYINRKAKLTFAALTEAWMRIICPEYRSDEKLAEFRKLDLYREIVEDFVPQLSLIFGAKRVDASSEGDVYSDVAN